MGKPFEIKWYRFKNVKVCAVNRQLTDTFILSFLNRLVKMIWNKKLKKKLVNDLIFLPTTWLALLEILSMASHTHWQNVLSETPMMFEDTLPPLYYLRKRRVQSRYWGLYLTCSLLLSCNKSQSFNAKKEYNPKLALRAHSVTDSDVLRTSFTIFIKWVDDIIIFLKSYDLKAEIELHESGENRLIESFFFQINDTK